MESDERQRPSGADLDERTKWLEGKTAWRKRIAQKTRKRQRYREDEEFPRKTLEVTAAWRAAHQEQINAWARQHRAINSEIREKDNARRREKPEPGRYLKRKYGISLADYNAMSTKQNGVCAICATSPEGKLCVGHDHGGKHIRELLCRARNFGLGFFKGQAESARGGRRLSAQARPQRLI
jgi:Recombination endonuclease VII